MVLSPHDLSHRDQRRGAIGFDVTGDWLWRPNTLIVTADHGGHDRDHGSGDWRDVAIPWIAWGRGVSPGHLTRLSIQTMDTASTVLWLLGLREPSDWLGAPVVDAFSAPSLQQATSRFPSR